jgi:hypothetical protein
MEEYDKSHDLNKCLRERWATQINMNDYK